MFSKIKKVILFFVAAILFGLNFYTANAAKGQVDEGYYIIESVLDRNKVLDIDSASVNDKANLRIWQKNGSDAQVFQISKAKNGYYTITAVCSGKVLDVAGGKKVAGTNVQQYKSNSSDAQMWEFEHVKDDIFTINSKLGNFCLDVERGKTNNGTNVLIWDKIKNKPNQQFRFIKVDSAESNFKDNDQEEFIPVADGNACVNNVDSPEEQARLAKILARIEDSNAGVNNVDSDNDSDGEQARLEKILRRIADSDARVNNVDSPEKRENSFESNFKDNDQEEFIPVADGNACVNNVDSPEKRENSFKIFDSVISEERSLKEDLENARNEKDPEEKLNKLRNILFKYFFNDYNSAASDVTGREVLFELLTINKAIGEGSDWTFNNIKLFYFKALFRQRDKLSNQDKQTFLAWARVYETSVRTLSSVPDYFYNYFINQITKMIDIIKEEINWNELN